jgi:hypothetical protein
MPSAVEARFYVSELKRSAYDPHATTVTLQVVSRGQHNKTWAAATPTGQITMTIKNESAADWFAGRLGAEVSVLFTPAPPEDLSCSGDELGSRYPGSAGLAGHVGLAVGRWLAGPPAGVHVRGILPGVPDPAERLPRITRPVTWERSCSHPCAGYPEHGSWSWHTDCHESQG